MSKNLSMSMLLDFYRRLLTDKQTDALDLYYNQDLSLAEIAEHLSITRQGVRDNIKRGERQLCDYEDKLGLAAKFSELADSCSMIRENIEKVKAMGVSQDVCAYLEEMLYHVGQIEAAL